MSEQITAEHFEARMGHPPYDDDLDRCNCILAGQIGHQMCGWDDRADLPIFVASAQMSEWWAKRAHEDAERDYLIWSGKIDTTGEGVHSITVPFRVQRGWRFWLGLTIIAPVAAALWARDKITGTAPYGENPRDIAEAAADHLKTTQPMTSQRTRKGRIDE